LREGNVYPIKQSSSVKSLRNRIQYLEKREKQLLNKLKIHDEILDSLPMNIFLEDREGKTLFANKEACKSNNKTREELEGKTVF